MVASAEQKRAYTARNQYGINALGKFVRKRSFRDIDDTDEGHLRQFDDEASLIAFEEDRYSNGCVHTRWSIKHKETVPKEQLALEYLENMEAMSTVSLLEGHKTRVHQEYVAEDLHKRHDEHDEKLNKLLEISDGKSGKQMELEEKKLEVAKAKKAAAEASKEAMIKANEELLKHVQSGDATPIQQKELQIKILRAEVDKMKLEDKLQKKASEASGGEPVSKRRRNAPKAKPVPMAETQEYKQGDKVTLNSRRYGQDMDAIVDENLGNGYYNVLLPARGGEVIRMKLPLRAASSN